MARGNFPKREPKSRIVTFRLSEQEYASLRSACGNSRSSISDITRKCVLNWAEAQTSPPTVDQWLAAIHGRLDMLYRLLDSKK
ncbi:MAG TPA: hypothetical protein VHW09_25300 [Bryobacteraceae bacterium]|jgi:hypothetical protein|nr:hypothetical protein [Bryobacteraceae bacterium]